MPRYVVDRILEAMNDRGRTLKGSQVLVLGAAYKPDVDDVRESPALDVIALLKKRGAAVAYHDPSIPELHHEAEGWSMRSVNDVMSAVRAADAVIVVTNHSVYDYPSILAQAKFIFDTRNALGKLVDKDHKVVRL